MIDTSIVNKDLLLEIVASSKTSMTITTISYKYNKSVIGYKLERAGPYILAIVLEQMAKDDIIIIHKIMDEDGIPILGHFTYSAHNILELAMK